MTTLRERLIGAQVVDEFLGRVEQLAPVLKDLSEAGAKLQANSAAMQIITNHYSQADRQKLSNMVTWATDRLPEFRQFLADLALKDTTVPPPRA
jgi:ribosomal 50S subunit-associated protein YjgA (DUF615 family)